MLLFADIAMSERLVYPSMKASDHASIFLDLSAESHGDY